MPKKTFQAAKKHKKKLIIQLKANQKKLLEDCMTIVNTSPNDGEYSQKTEKHRNRIENRTVRVYVSAQWNIRDYQWAEYIKTIIVVVRKVLKFNTKTKEYVENYEESIYLSDQILQAKQAYKCVRSHWFIENKDHHVRDVTLEEDKSRIRIKPENMSTLRSFALNVLRRNKLTNINDEIYKNSLKYDNLYSYQQFI